MPVCDIVIPVWNQAEATACCLESIKKNTRVPYRLIIVDNGSDSATKKLLENFTENNKNLTVTLLRNEKNEGFVKAVNQGIRLSTGEYSCILNNDTIVTDGWLSEMLDIMAKDPRIGIVNPSSNTLGQKLPHGLTPEEFAKTAKGKKGLYVELGGALGFSLVTRRSLFDEIGLLDERYGIGNYDDTDFSLRAKSKGYKIVRAIASYVYHKESSSFNFLKSYKSDFRKNKDMFESRWGKTKRVVVVFKDINDKTLKTLKGVLKENAKEKSWVYVISPFFDTGEFFENWSNLSFAHFKRFFYPLALLKVLFKKKRPDIVYADSIFSGLLSRFKICRGAEIKTIDQK